MIFDVILNTLRTEGASAAYTQDDGQTFSYNELYKFVCNIYGYLLSKKTDGNVIVYGHKEVYMKACMLACSFAGITYIPVDSSTPEERVSDIINQAEPSLIFGDIETTFCKTVSSDEINRIMNRPVQTEINEISLKPDDICYMIFTSGSTGQPKGVKVTYSNLDSCIKWVKEITGSKKEVILNQANFSFDLSVADFYLSLVTGSEHFIIGDISGFDFSSIFRRLEKSGATIAVFTPSFADLLMLDRSFSAELLPKLHTILFCGEKLSTKTVQKLFRRFPDLKIINSYGPTECTFAVTSVLLTKDSVLEENISIGSPKKDVEIIICDENLSPLPDGETGEIMIAGASVADGYLNNYGRKAFIEYDGRKAYLTGDLAYRQKGLLYYKSRKDNQIKYKGYRIELTDIESNLLKIDSVEEACVVAKRNKNGDVTGIFGFVKIKENCSTDVQSIEKELSSKLPLYMCPKVRIINDIPLTANGKRDVKKLSEEYI
ncbi:MAG: AMP-binding protein [Clostridia bacterium]|nr:AMP-binding protein [Clostridia bacterium]